MFDQSLTSIATGTSVPATQPQLPNDSDRRRVLYIEDMYDPDTVSDADASKYLVPRIGELIIDVINKIIYLCTAVADQGAKYKPTLEVWERIGQTNEYDEVVEILGLPGGFQGDAILAIDYSVQPPRAVVDGREWAPNAAYAKLYKGDIVGSTGQIISSQYNTSSDLISDRVPVTLAASDKLTNSTIMVCLPCSVNLNADELPDGSRATVVFFDQAGNMIRGARSLSVQHTAVLKDHNLSIRYIDSVELIAPWFMDSTNPEQLNLPINVALKTAVFRAKINYSNGEEEIINIDGKKCSLLGLNQYAPTYVGQKSSLVLSYSLGDNEQVKMADAGAVYQVRRTYKVTAVSVNGTYSPKIYTYPIWTGNGWGLKHFLYDLERSVSIDVSAYVTLNKQSNTFNPTSYGVEQSLILNLTLSDVSPQYSPWTHVQYTTIVLYQQAQKQGKHWDVRYTYGADPYVGYNVQSTISNNQTILSMGGTYSNQDAWLNRLYKLVQPLVNDYTETKAPTPNVGEVMTLNGAKTRFNIEDWNKLVTVNEVIDEGQTLFIRWLQIDSAGNELQLGITGITASANPSNDDSDNGSVEKVVGYVSDADFTLSDSEILAGQSITATVIARNISGIPIPNVEVAFTPSTSYPVTVVSNADGKAIAEIDLSVVGLRTIVAATSKGQTKSKSVMVLSTSTILKQNSLVLSKAVVKAGVESYQVNATVVNELGETLAGVNVVFRTIGANGSQITTQTDSDGVARATFNPNNVGTDNVVASILTGSTLQTTVTVTQ